MWSYVSAEQRVPADHPLRAMRRMVDDVLERLSPRLDELYSKVGRPSIPPEHLLRALLLQVLYTIRSERMLMEQLDYNLLFRWFVGLRMDDGIWDPTVFTKNRRRLLEGEIAQAFFQEVLALASQKNLTSDEHFTVDATLIEAWAGHKSFRPRPGKPGKGPGDPGRNSGEDFRGQTRSNATHQSTTDPEARLARKGPGKEAKLSYLGHVLMENRNGLVVDAQLTQVDGLAERRAAEEMLRGVRTRRRGRISVGADKGYDTREFVSALRAMRITPHVAQNDTNRRSAIDGRTTRQLGYRISQQRRKLVEQVFGWLKTVGGLRKTRHRGTQRVAWMFIFSMAAFDLLRISHLEALSG
jgi:transposase